MVIINGQIYSDGEAPDFGSVELVGAFHEHGENRYIFKDEDKDKLALLTMAGSGSLAYCSDGKYALIKHCGEWVSV